jgi:hypothetical protein
MSPTIYLRFPDEGTFVALLPHDFGAFGECGFPLPAGITAMRVIGRIEKGGEWDADGNVITPPVQLPGWHVNVLGELPSEWQSYRIHPATPLAVFGGDTQEQ